MVGVVGVVVVVFATAVASGLDGCLLASEGSTETGAAVDGTEAAAATSAAF